MPAFNEAEIALKLDRLSQRLRAAEEQIAVLSEKAGVPYANPSAGVPADVVELARAGKTLEAIKRYRELTGAGSDEAKQVVLSI